MLASHTAVLLARIARFYFSVGLGEGKWSLRPTFSQSWFPAEGPPPLMLNAQVKASVIAEYQVVY